MQSKSTGRKDELLTITSKKRNTVYTLGDVLSDLKYKFLPDPRLIELSFSHNIASIVDARKHVIDEIG